MLDRGLRVAAVVGLLFAAQACGKTVEPPAGTNTNWLGTCEDDGDCRDGNECICGVCTRFCSGASECAGLGDARCTNVAECGGAANDEPASPAACLLGCDGDEDCAAVVNGVCREGACLPRATVGGGAGSSAPRPDGGPGVDPYALVRNDNEVAIGAAYLACAVDEDCTLVGTGCDGCCQWGAIDADLKERYQENFVRACADFRGGFCNCEAKPTVATCVAGTCRAIEACISPTQYPERGDDIGAIGCPCDQPGDSICIGSAALACNEPVGGAPRWMAVEDGPCDLQLYGCMPALTRDDPADCLDAYITCRELPNGQFCGDGCHEPLDCERISCAPYAPFQEPECLDGVEIYEGLCDDGKLRYRTDHGGYGGGTRYWDAATGALVAYRGTSDTPGFCDNTSHTAELGDRDAIARCDADENTREKLCPKPIEPIDDCVAQPLNCDVHSCADYAPFDIADCGHRSGGVSEGSCPGVRYRRLSHYGSETYWWDAESGTLLTYVLSSDTTAFCEATSAHLVFGDPSVPETCPAMSEQSVCE